MMAVYSYTDAPEFQYPQTFSDYSFPDFNNPFDGLPQPSVNGAYNFGTRLFSEPALPPLDTQWPSSTANIPSPSIFADPNQLNNPSFSPFTSDSDTMWQPSPVDGKMMVEERDDSAMRHVVASGYHMAHATDIPGGPNVALPPEAESLFLNTTGLSVSKNHEYKASHRSIGHAFNTTYQAQQNTIPGELPQYHLPEEILGSTLR